MLSMCAVQAADLVSVTLYVRLCGSTTALYTESSEWNLRPSCIYYTCLTRLTTHITIFYLQNDPNFV